MDLYPKAYLNSVKEIDIDFLKNNNIKGIILDVDNTLVNYYKEIGKGIDLWVEKMKQSDIKLCILSNTNDVEKVQKVASKLNIPYFYFAKKPSKSGFLKAKRLFGLESYEIAVVGDQIFTDVIGANRCNMFSILVNPIDKKDIFMTRIKRPIEKKIVERYLKKRKVK